jgi:hypothetical protein
MKAPESPLHLAPETPWSFEIVKLERVYERSDLHAWQDAEKKRPANTGFVPVGRKAGIRGPQKKIRRRPTLPRGLPRSTIGSGGLNYRVRDGNGWDPSDIATGKSVSRSDGAYEGGINVRRRFSSSEDERPRATLLKRAWALASHSVRSRLQARSQRDEKAGQGKPHEQLVSVSSTHYCASTPDLSTSWSSTALQGLSPGRPNLEVGFPLRCFQRLSNRHMATQRCRWRDNWYTRGVSIPVLSY